VPEPKPAKLDDESEDLICGEISVFQAEKGYRLGIETLLLSSFVKAGAKHMVDLGTGCGILPLVLCHFGKVKRATGVEIQASLADRARRAVAKNRLASKIRIVEADLRDLTPVLESGAFDLVVSNPPYTPVRSGHINQKEERALARHEIKCTVADVAKTAAKLLAPKGSFVSVFPSGRLPELLRVCADNGLRPARMRMIHGRIELTAKHFLLESIRGGRMGLSVEKPLIVYEKPGKYSVEVKEMLYPSGWKIL